MTASFEFVPAAVPACTAWWRVVLPDPTACIRLWCFPCIGAGTALWHPIRRGLSGAAEIVALRLPGRECRAEEAPLSNLHELAERLAAELAPVADERDVYLGYGMGGLLAFEIARRLQVRGVAAPRGLVVCGARAPHLCRGLPSLHRLDPAAFVAAVENRYGPIPSELRDRPEFLELLLPPLRADLEALETYQYQPGPSLGIPVCALGGRSDPLVAGPHLTGWRLHTTGRFDVAQVPGGHFALTDHPHRVGARVRLFLATL